MNNKSFQALKLAFALVLVVSLLLPESSTLALPQKAAPLMDDLVPFEPNDTEYSSQWHYSGPYGINAPDAWGIAWDTTAGGGPTAGLGQTVVAVLDTGITSHEDLDPDRIRQGYDFVSTVANDNDIDTVA